MVVAVWLSFLLAAVQTYVLGNPFGSPPKLIIEQARFTTFSAPQSYAAFLVSAAAVILFVPSKMTWRHDRLLTVVTGIGIATGLVLVGSRYVFIGASMMLLVWGALALRTRLQRSTISRAAALRAVLVGLGAFVIIARISRRRGAGQPHLRTTSPRLAWAGQPAGHRHVRVAA